MVPTGLRETSSLIRVRSGGAFLKPFNTHISNVKSTQLGALAGAGHLYDCSRLRASDGLYMTVTVHKFTNVCESECVCISICEIACEWVCVYEYINI